MVQEIVNVIDTGALSLLAQSDNLDLLLAGDRKVVITQDVLDEATGDLSRPNSIKIQQWYNENKAAGNVLIEYGDNTPVTTQNTILQWLGSESSPNHGIIVPEYEYPNIEGRTTQIADYGIRDFAGKAYKPNDPFFYQIKDDV